MKENNSTGYMRLPQRRAAAFGLLNVLVAVMVTAGTAISLSGCCGMPLLGKCSPSIPVEINYVADNDSNNNRSVKVYIYLFNNSEAFMNMSARDFFATGKETYVSSELKIVSGPIDQFVRPGERVAATIDVPRDKLGDTDNPLFLGMIAHFSAPAPGEDRILIPLTGRDFAKVMDIQVTTNSLLPAK